MANIEESNGNVKEARRAGASSEFGKQHHYAPGRRLVVNRNQGRGKRTAELIWAK